MVNLEGRFARYKIAKAQECKGRCKNALGVVEVPGDSDHGIPGVYGHNWVYCPD